MLLLYEYMKYSFIFSLSKKESLEGDIRKADKAIHKNVLKKLYIS